MADPQQQVPSAAEDGLRELNGLEAMLFGRYVEAQHGAWRRGMGPPRMVKDRQISQQIPVICRVTAYVRGETDGSWLRQWAADQLCLNDPEKDAQWNTGIDGIEPGVNHYGAFTRGVISYAIQVAIQKGDQATATVLTAWLRAAMLWYALSSGPLGTATLGQRNQQHDNTVTTDELRSAASLPVNLKRVAKQSYYLPVRIFRAGVSGGVFSELERAALRALVLNGDLGAVMALPSLAAAVIAIRVRNRFELRRYAWGSCAAMLRADGETYDDQGSCAYACAVDQSGMRRLEPDVKRKPTPDRCETSLVGGIWTATTTDVATGAQASLVVDTNTLGPLRYVVRVPVLGPPEIGGS